MRLETDVVCIGAQWTCDDALAVLGRNSARVVIVDRGDRDTFWSRSYSKTTMALAGKGALTVAQALSLAPTNAWAVVPSVASRPDVDSVVVDRGVVAGVFVAPQRGLESMGSRDHVGQMATPTPRGLKARAPSHVTVGKTASLVVEIANDVAKTMTATFAATAGDKVLIVVIAQGPIEIVGDQEATLVVDDAKPPVTRFELRGVGAGEAVIDVEAWLGGGRVASLTLTTIVHTATEPAPEVEVSAELEAPEEIDADLDLLIIEDRLRQRYRLIMQPRPAVGLERKTFEFKLDEDVDAYFTQFFREIEAILTSTDDAKVKLYNLRVKGSALAGRILPDGLHQLLWSLRTTKKVRTISIQSEEPWVPWELCRLSGKDEAGNIVDGLFLSEEFTVTRWLPKVPDVKTLTLTSIGLVVPPDSGLPAASAEASYLRSLKCDGRDVVDIDPTLLGLHEALATGPHDGLHFTGHGTADATNADHASIRLAQNVKFRPENISGSARNFGRKHPIVILNACQIARGGTVLGGLGGWPQAFVRNGAGAFIGPYWNVDDGKASAFAQAVYGGLIEGKTVPEAVRSARAEIQTSNDPTWLAYVVYSHPDAKLA